MTTHNEFLNAFGRLNMNQQTGGNSQAPQTPSGNTSEYCHTYPRRQPHHELLFDYPALHLLSRGEAAWLPHPHLVEYRTKPSKGDFRFDFYNPDVFYHMHPKQPTIDAKAFQGNQTISNVVKTIDALSNTSGRSTLSICPFETRQNQIFVRMQLKRTSAAGDSDFVFWKLSIADWSILFSMQESRAWLQILMDVVHRKTALTYLIAAQKLQSQNGYLWQCDSEKWERKWNTRSAAHATTLFQSRLSIPNEKRRLSMKDFGSAAAKGQDKCEVQLPCNHKIKISKKNLQGLSEEDCRSLACPTCGALILQKSDLEEAEMCANQTELEHAAKMSDGWTELGWNDLSSSKVTFDKNVLTMSLHSAAWSLKAPALVVSKFLCPFSTEETDTALKALEGWLSMQSNPMRRSPSDLFEVLQGVVWYELRSTSADKNAADISLPPGWTDFLTMWLTRAIKFAYQRSCSGFGKEHEGTHLHQSDGLVYWQNQEGQELQAVNTALGGMGLNDKKTHGMTK